MFKKEKTEQKLGCEEIIPQVNGRYVTNSQQKPTAPIFLYAVPIPQLGLFTQEEDCHDVAGRCYIRTAYTGGVKLHDNKFPLELFYYFLPTVSSYRVFPSILAQRRANQFFRYCQNDIYRVSFPLQECT